MIYDGKFQKPKLIFCVIFHGLPIFNAILSCTNAEKKQMNFDKKKHETAPKLFLTFSAFSRFFQIFQSKL